MEKFKFCHIIDGSNFNPLLFNSVKYSNREKFKYTVISLEPENGLQQQMAELGVESFSLNYSSRRQAVSAVWQLYNYFRREKIHIVQTHLFHASLIGLTAARLARVPVTIFTGHHSHETPLYGRKLLTFVDGLNGRLLAKHTIAPSQQMKDIFAERLKVPSAKIDVVHHGFDLAAWQASAAVESGFRREFGIEDKIVFGAVGRLWWVKGFDTMIEAFGHAASGREDVVLVIVGGGDKSELTRLIDARGLQHKVILAGRREDIAAVMNSFDVFIHSSIAESFGMVFIEAFALGKPVVTTNVGIAGEIIKEGVNGFLANMEGVPGLSAALRKVLDVQADWRKMAESGKQTAEYFAVQKTQSACDELYGKWLDDSAR